MLASGSVGDVADVVLAVCPQSFDERVDLSKTLWPSYSAARCTICSRFEHSCSVQPWCRTESAVVGICWAVFAGAVAFQVSSMLLQLHTRRAPLLPRAAHAGLGIHLAVSAWLTWEDTPRDHYRSSMAVNVVACVVSVVYNCRVLQPFGIRVGQSLLPILNSVGRREFAAMAMLIFVTLFATLLYVCIEFDTDLEGLQRVQTKRSCAFR